MHFLRTHWVDLGAVLAVGLLGYLFTHPGLPLLQKILWWSLVGLFFHQLEEYRVVGTFPGMVNKIVFKSDCPDRYPLNTNTALIINVGIGWTSYFLAALFYRQALWLGIATMLVSLGNIVAHTIVFNSRGKRWYNAGMFTCWLCFAPCLYFFCKEMILTGIASTLDFIIGIPLGIFFNVGGIFGLINLLADRQTKFIFDQRNLLPGDRKK